VETVSLRSIPGYLRNDDDVVFFEYMAVHRTSATVVLWICRDLKNFFERWWWLSDLSLSNEPTGTPYTKHLL